MSHPVQRSCSIGPRCFRRAWRRLQLVAPVLLFGWVLIARAQAGTAVKVEDLCRAVVEDPNYKVRVQAALVLGKLGDLSAVPSLIKALAALSVRGAGKRAKIFLSFGPFTGGVKSAGPDATKIIQDTLARELGKLPAVTLTLAAADQHNFARTGLQGFYIDGNITRLDETAASGGSETSCNVKVMVARWPTKSIISWTNAGASVQSGSRPSDKVGARRDCLEASAGQLAEDLGRFFKAQGG